MSICKKTATLIFLDLELVHCFIHRKLVIQSQYMFQVNPTPAHFILVTGHVLSATPIVLVVFQAQVILRPTVRWPVCFGVGPPSAAHDQIFITVGHVRFSCWGAHSLTRRWDCNLFIQFAVTLRSKSHRTYGHILLSHFRAYVTVSYKTSPTWRARSLYLYSPGTGWSSYIKVKVTLRLTVSQSVSMSWCWAPFGSYVTFDDYCCLWGAPSLTRGRVCRLSVRVCIVEVEVKLWLTVSWPVGLGVRHPSGTRDQFFFLLEILFRQLWVCYFVASSLTRERVCKLLLLLVLASAVPRDSRPYFIAPILETPPTWRARSLYLYPPWTRWTRYTPGHWVLFPLPLMTRRATVEVFYPASTQERVCIWPESPSSSSSSYIVTDSQSASSSWCLAPFGAGDQMLHFSEWQLLSLFFL
jgi:hypothetical protein